jgi:hypothetical protein
MIMGQAGLECRFDDARLSLAVQGGMSLPEGECWRMSEKLTFHFEGALTESHRMNFYEAARFQYAAARLMVKLAQFRADGRFVKNITNGSNPDIRLADQSSGSFNIVIEDSSRKPDEQFVDTSLSDLVAYVSDRVIEKIDDNTLGKVRSFIPGGRGVGKAADKAPVLALDDMIEAAIADKKTASTLPAEVNDLMKRRSAEAYREKRLVESQSTVSRIDLPRSQKLIAMSAPLMSEMATALRKSATSLEVKTSVGGKEHSVLFLDRQMAQEIETALVDQEITVILGNVIQFNKDNGWGKIKIENGSKTIGFSVPSDILPSIRQGIIESMQTEQVFLQTNFVRDRSDEVVRLIVIDLLPLPPI